MPLTAAMTFMGVSLLFAAGGPWGKTQPGLSGAGPGVKRNGQVGIWKMFFRPVVMNSTAMAARIRPMIRVKMLIPVLPSFLAM